MREREIKRERKRERDEWFMVYIYEEAYTTNQCLYFSVYSIRFLPPRLYILRYNGFTLTLDILREVGLARDKLRELGLHVALDMLGR